MFFDVNYFIIVGPFMLLSMWASWKVKSAFNKWDQYRTQSGATGAQVARALLDNAGLQHVTVERVEGQLTDHYDPSAKALRLSDSTYDSPSIAAVGVAAHEAGHAIQDKVKYPMLEFRSAIVPLAGFGSNLSFFIIFAGILLSQFTKGPLGFYAILAGIVLFSAVVIFQLVTVPVELDASNRAKQILQDMNFATAEEGKGVSAVLNAAAWTYVAAALTGISTLIYYVTLLLGSRDE